MLYLEKASPARDPLQTWQTAIKHARIRRLPADDLDHAFRELSIKYNLPRIEIAKVLLRFRSHNSCADDPLVYRYAQKLARMRIVRVEDLLFALLDTSHYAQGGALSGPVTWTQGHPWLDERLFHMCVQLYMDGDLACDRSQWHGLVRSLSRWMHELTRYETQKQLEEGALRQVDPFSAGVYDALATLVFTVASNNLFRGVMKETWWKKRKVTFMNEMDNFDARVLQWMGSTLAGRLIALANIPPFIESDAKGLPVLRDVQIVQSIADLPIVNTRAGLYIWLSACFSEKTLPDDTSIVTYLQNRYGGQIQAFVVDFVVASFDVLTATLLRKEPEHKIKVVQSFICNKLPLLLALVNTFATLGTTLEADIQTAFMSITVDVDPPDGTRAESLSTSPRQIRLDFLHACVLHALISDATVLSITRETTSTPKATKYTRESLIAKFGLDISSLERLFAELDSMQGNASAIAGCVVDIVTNLCVVKDTINLKTACHMLLKRLSSIDILMLFVRPVVLLSPLCMQLENWQHDQDQPEFTPAYEEFASILTFILAVAHRYRLEASDIGVDDQTSFVGSMLEGGSANISVRNLDEEQNELLSKWIEGLFATDEHGETTGISDEVMRPCTPSAFYRLVPTLFEQSVQACRSGALSMKAFKGGLELLVEPFLLPSLIGGLRWLVEHLWEDHGDADVLLQLLNKLVKPAISSAETKAMHAAAMTVVAKPLYSSLQTWARQRPDSKTVVTLAETLKQYLDQPLSTEISRTELEKWSSPTSGGMLVRVRGVINDHVLWLSNLPNLSPPRCNFKMLTMASQTVGASAVLEALVLEVVNHSSLETASMALDVCVALISAPQASETLSSLPPGNSVPQRRGDACSLRYALQRATSDAQELLQKPASVAEALVRLSRRVEAQLAVAQMPQLAIPLQMPNQDTDQLMVDLGLADTQVDPAVAEASLESLAALGQTSSADFNADIDAVLAQPVNLDITQDQPMADLPSELENMPTADVQNILDNLNMDFTQTAQQPGNVDDTNVPMPGLQNAEEDMWAGLDMGNLDEDFSFT